LGSGSSSAPNNTTPKFLETLALTLSLGTCKEVKSRPEVHRNANDFMSSTGGKIKMMSDSVMSVGLPHLTTTVGGR